MWKIFWGFIFFQIRENGAPWYAKNQLVMFHQSSEKQNMQENENAVLAYHSHAAEDVLRIAMRFLNRIMCPIRLQGVVFTGVW